MYLPNVYTPLTKLNGFIMWDFDSRYEIMYFYYKLKVDGNELKLFLYIFTNESFSGAEHFLDYPDQKNNAVLTIVEHYKKVANVVIERRDRIKKLFEDLS